MRRCLKCGEFKDEKFDICPNYGGRHSELVKQGFKPPEKGQAFFLEEGETVIEKIEYVVYYGTQIVTTGGSFGLYGGGLFGGLSSSKTYKKKASFMDAVLSNLYLTNKKIVVLKKGTGIFNFGQEENIVLMIYLDSIIKINPSDRFLGGKHVDFNIKDNSNNVYDVSIAMGTDGLKRDQFIKKILNTRNEFINKLKLSNDIKIDDPIEIIKIRYAKGEITKDEYLEIKKMLEY